MNSLLALIVGLIAHETKLERFSFEEPHMGTKFAIVVYATDKDKARTAAKEAFSRVAELNRIMSDYDPTSELMRLCEKSGGEAVKVSEDLYRVLRQARQVSELSDGAFDITVSPFVRLWRLSRKTRTLPTKEKLEAARAVVGWKLVELNDKDRSVKLLKPGMLLDLGGIAKGYAADEMLRVLKRRGLSQALIAAGGDITVGDAPPGKDGWKVAIASVDAKKEGPRSLMLKNASVSTSGDAEQYVEIGEVRYSHIVDPKTGLGLVGRMSATVIAPNGITADSLTKVVAILGPKKGFELIEKQRGVSGRYVLKTDEKTEVSVSRSFPTLVE
jgi:thiamine biosynthesis lipoprotein